MQNLFKKYITFFVVILLVGIASYFIYQKINPRQLPDNLIASSGRIDGDLILLNTKYAGRVDKILVKGGDVVRLKQKIAILNSDEFSDKEKAIDESIKALKKEKLSFMQSIEAQNLKLHLLQKTLPKIQSIKEENVKNLKHTLQSIKLKIQKLSLSVNQTKKDYKRYKTLFATKVISAEKFETQELKYKTIINEFKTLKIEKDKMINNIKSAKNLLQIAKDNLAQIDIAKQNILSLKTKASSLEYKIKRLHANKNEINTMINELTLKSPTDGFVIEKVANEGEVIGAGAIVVTLSDTSSYYLKLFVDTMSNGKIKIGDKAEIFLDSYPNKPIPSKVISISARAEFTPKDVSVRSDRIQRVYAVHLRPLKYDPLLKLGIPAIGVISIDGKGLPKSLKDIPEI